MKLNELTVEDMVRLQKSWSMTTFGPGRRTEGLCDHIRKELKEVEESGGSLDEWIDVLTLAIDGCWRAGGSPEEVALYWTYKHIKNKKRTWPDWRTVPKNKAIEHKRGTND